MSSLPSFFLPKNAFHPVRSRPVEGMATAASGRPASNGVHDRTVTIHDAEMIRQMRKVLRLQKGDLFLALDGAGHEYTCRAERVERDGVHASIVDDVVTLRETPIPVILYPSLIRRERFALLLEKCTELGVSRFFPIAAHRSPFQEITPHLRERWEHIIREAAEVARRGVLPHLAPVARLEEALETISSEDGVLVLGTQQNPPAGGMKTAQAIPEIMHGKRGMHLFVGPEGDYTPEEYGLFKERGVAPFSLGPRIVRSETAAIAAVALFTAFL